MKFLMQIVYMFLFILVLIPMMKGLPFLWVFLSEKGLEVHRTIQAIPMIIFALLVLYSLWLAKESAEAFAEGDCLFVEAIIISFKKSLLYLPFLPIVGGYFEKQERNKQKRSDTKEIDPQTRFDRDL